MKYRACICLPVYFCALYSLALAEEAKDRTADNIGVVRAVTLYRDRALVTREIAVPAGEKLRTIHIPRLPDSVIPESVYADADEPVAIRAVRVSPHVAAQANREDVRALEKQIQDLNGQRAEIQQSLDGVARDLETLNQMVNLSAAFGKADLNRGVLNAETLVEMTNFSMTKRRELAAERFQQEKKLAAIDRQLQQLGQEKNLATQGTQSTSYDATIFIETGEDAAGTVRLSYSVGSCGWSPQYTVHGRIGKPSFEIQYSALVQQMSGEDWSDVRLTLSTASPVVSAARPTLNPLRVVSADPAEVAKNTKQMNQQADPFGRATAGEQSTVLSGMIQSLKTQQQFVEAQLDHQGFANLPGGRDAALNSLAGQMQQIELQAKAESWRTLAPDVTEDVASQIYKLPRLVSLVSRRQQQLVQILETELAGEMYHVATPLLSTFAYREAQMTNTEPIGLLSGPATVYLDDRFVGRTEIPSTASGQKLTIGFGADQQVRTRRELLDKEDTVKGGNRQLTFKYRLVLANFKDKPVKVRLIDRMPNTRQAQQLSVTLDAPKQPLSEDGLYNRIERPMGLLRWDLDVPAGRHGSKAYDVLYNFKMEFDRNQVPTAQDAIAEMQAEFDNTSLPAGMGGFGGGFGGGFN